MARVALGADVIIAFLDPGDAQHAAGIRALGPHLAAGDEIILCATVYAEIIVRPLQSQADAKVDEFLAAIGARVVPVDRALARTAAELRSRHPKLRLPDALALATALDANAGLLTLDQSLKRVAERESRPDR